MSESVGVFARLRNLWTGFMSLWISDLEAEHPEAVYEAAIRARVDQYNEFKKQTANLVYLRNKLSTTLDEKTKELADVEAQLTTAVDAGEDEVALLLIEKKDALNSEIEELRSELAATQAQAEEAKKGLIAFQADIRKLKHEKEAMLAKAANAEARKKIQSALDGFSTDAEIKALDGVRESIHKKVAEADVGREIAEESLDAKLEKIKQKTASASARAQLDALKKARMAASAASQGADAAKKTL